MYGGDEGCMEDVWRMYGGCMEDVWRMYGGCMEEFGLSLTWNGLTATYKKNSW
jgi:hypothetical protein